MRARADARSVFEGTLPAPSPRPPLQFLPRVSRPGCCPREGFPLRFLLHFPLRFRGAGGRLGKSAVTGQHPSCARDPHSAGGTAATAAVPSPSSDRRLPLPGRASTPPFPPSSPAALGLTSALHPPGLGPAARSCLPQPPSRGPQPPPTPPHGPGAMSELEQLRQEAEQLRNQIRVRGPGCWAGEAERAGPGGLHVLTWWVVDFCVCGYPSLSLSPPLHSSVTSFPCLLLPLSSCLFLMGSAISSRMPEKHVGIQH